MAVAVALLPGRYAICRLPPDAPAPALTGDFVSITRTAAELSVIAPEDRSPEGAVRSGGWRLLRLEGPFDLSLTGILAPLATALAAAGVSLLPVGTYDTDYLLVRETQLDAALAALAGAGCTVTPADPSSPAG
ncbi:MAG: ACT domain-containing protein [Geminicoccaceae bacterium]